MDAVYQFLASYEGLIYILLTLGGLFAFRWTWKSWHEWRDSVFGLEREFAMRRLSQAFIISLLILFLFFGELFLASFIVPSLPASDLIGTPTLDVLGKAEGALSANPVGLLVGVTPASGLSPASADGCEPGEIMLTSPEPGDEVSGTITLTGTVEVNNLGFYKYEVSPQGADTWATISASRDAVKNGDIGYWDTTSLTPGDYQLRLEVTDNQGQAYPACVIPVRVRAP